MNVSFSVGTFVDTAGGLIEVTTASAIHGLCIVIPASIAWKTAATLLEHGGSKRGYLGIVGQAVALPAHQAAVAGRTAALLVSAVSADSPAAQAGVLVGDILLALDSKPITSSDDLLDLLAANPIGQSMTLQVLRGGAVTDIAVTIGERPAR